MITTSIKLSIEVENGDETEKDEFLKTISYLYHYEFVKENSGYGNKRYLQYLLTPAVLPFSFTRHLFLCNKTLLPHRV